MQIRRLSLVQILAVVIYCLGAAPALAADPASPVDGAHQTLKQLINKGYVGANADNSLHYISYRGFRCHSTLEIRHEYRDIDWTLMTSVTDFAEFAHAHGPVIRTDINGLKDTEKDAGFWLADADTAKQFANAMRVLLISCAPKAKSD